MHDELVIRPARPEDRADMERVCAHTFEWGDYVPEAWDDWLADKRGLLIVGEAGERVVALSKITFQTSEQVWLEGMRVDPEYRRRGIAGQFLDYSIAYARNRGAKVVRLGTGDHNRAAHRLTARAGMERIGAYILWIAEPLPDCTKPSFLAPCDQGQVESFLASCETSPLTQGLYSADWSWEKLTADRLAQFLQNGQVAAQQPTDGMTALATLHGDPDDGLWIGLAAGDRSSAVDVAELAMTLRAHAHEVGAQRVAVMLPELAWLREAFGTAGFGYGDWKGELWVFERLLSARGDHES